QSEREEAFARLEQLRRKGTVNDYNVELASYRTEKYGK
ncbi:UDP-N-acetylenolpyruvoylglucosamine reductase, partial [bacterium 1xD42-62]|nr:UDP-N-acetylenolpyruvoylglucosamine reductase [Parablautia muri]